MTTTTIPLVGNLTTRNIDAAAQLVLAKDQRFSNVVLEASPGGPTGSTSIFCNKRVGNTAITGSFSGNFIDLLITQSESESSTLYSLNNSGLLYLSINDGINTFGWTSNANNIGFAGTNSSAITIGHISETLINDIPYACVLREGAFWYHPMNATGTTFTGDRTSGSPVVSGIASTTGFYSGQPATGTGFTAANRILTVDSATQVTMTENASSGAPTSTVFTIVRIAKVLDADFPSTAKGRIAFMDGYAFVITASGRVYNSGLNDVTTWRANDYITANISTDTGVSVTTYKQHIVAFGLNSTEFFYNAGNSSGSILSRRSEAFSRIGLVGPDAFKVFQDTIYFVGNSAESGFGVYKINGFSPEKISDDISESILSSVSGSSADFNLSIINMFGKNMVKVSHPNNSGTPLIIVYDIELGVWLPWAVVSGVLPFNAVAWGQFARKFFLGGAATIYEIAFNNPRFTEAAQAYSMVVQTEPKSLNNGMPFIINNINLLADTQSSGSTTIATSANDYTSFGTVGSFDLTQVQKNLPGGGYYDSSVAFKLTDSGNNAWRGQALVVDWEPAA